MPRAASSAVIYFALLIAFVGPAIADPCPQPRPDENKLDNHSCSSNRDGHEVSRAREMRRYWAASLIVKHGWGDTSLIGRPHVGHPSRRQVPQP
jgi:hypothetical protein